MDAGMIVFLVASLTVVIFVLAGVKVVPQSENWVVERFGKYRRTLTAGLNFIIPILDRVPVQNRTDANDIGGKLNILEQQSPKAGHDVITKDNVQITIWTTIFFKIIDASKAKYRIQNYTLALENAVTGIVRAIVGSIEFDDVQSHRDHINSEIRDSLGKVSQDWGIEVTRTEILDVDVDENTKRAMQEQINAERKRRAEVLKAEGDRKAIELRAEAEKKAVQLEADATLYKAQREAEAKRALAEADAFATETVAAAINNGGGPAIEFEVLKRQVVAVSEIASSENSKIIVLPNEIIKALDSVKGIFAK